MAHIGFINLSFTNFDNEMGSKITCEFYISLEGNVLNGCTTSNFQGPPRAIGGAKRDHLNKSYFDDFGGMRYFDVFIFCNFFLENKWKLHLT